MSRSQRRISSAWLFAAGVLAALAGGCQTLPPSLVPCPMPSVEQASRIQQIVPVGTSRAEAIEKLKQAGIEGKLSTADSIFYCDTWTQSDKERWHINVELMFDETGALYAYRPDPKHAPENGAEEAGTAKAAKKPKEIAAGPKASVVDPFAE